LRFPQMPFFINHRNGIIRLCNISGVGGVRRKCPCSMKASIGDCTRLRRERIDQNGLLMLYMSKTGEPVSVPLPPVCIEALRALPVEGDQFFCRPGERMATIRERFRERLAVAWRKTGFAPKLM